MRGTEVRGLKKKGRGKEKGNEKVKRSDRKCEGERTRIIQSKRKQIKGKVR